MQEITIRVRDQSHLEAHRADFLFPLEEIMTIVEAAANRRSRTGGGSYPREDKFVCKCGKAVGRGGLARIWPWTRGDYWASRPGRSIPSHLIRGKARKTANLCVWGFWVGPDTFEIHTIYPGKPAPREIHDPALPLAEISRAVAFWKTHAIIVAG